MRVRVAFINDKAETFPTLFEGIRAILVGLGQSISWIDYRGNHELIVCTHLPYTFREEPSLDGNVLYLLPAETGD